MEKSANNKTNQAELTSFINLKKNTTDNFININQANEITDEPFESKSRKNPIQKFCEIFEPGTLKDCVFNLCLNSLGPIVLALPQTISQFSLLFFPIITILSGLINYWVLLILSNSFKTTKRKTYEEIVLKIFGKKLRFFLSCIIIINQLGIIILYQVIFYKLIGGIINELGKFKYDNSEEFSKKSFWSKPLIKYLVNNVISICILFPLFLLKSISRIKFMSIFGIICFFILILIVIFQSPFFIYSNIYQKKQKINKIDILSGIKEDMKLLKIIPSIFFVFSWQIGVFPILESFHLPTNRRIRRLFRFSSIIVVSFYLIISIFGYLTQPFNTPDLIIERNKIAKFDLLMTFGRFLLLFEILAKIWTNYHLLRSCLLNLFGYDRNKFTNITNIFIACPTLIFTTLISVIFQSITGYIGLIGSFCSVIISFLFPGLIYIKTSSFPLYHWKNILPSIFFIFMTLLGFSSGFFIIKDIIHKK